MKIEIKNFGPISNLKFDLTKDLHLIYGQNAIGKSYATYCLYSIIKNITNKSYKRNFFRFHNNEGKFQKIIKKKLKELDNNNRIDITELFNSIIEKKLKEIILNGLQNSLQNTFSSLKNLKNRFSKENYEIIIHISKNESVNLFSDDEGKLDLKYITNGKQYEIVKKNTKTTKFSIYQNGKKSFAKPNENDFSEQFEFYCFKNILTITEKLDFKIRDVYYLPASRSGLYQALSAFTPIIAELTQNRFFMQNRTIELPSLSEPLSDYFIDLSTVDIKQENKEFRDIINFLQDDILKGKVKYNEKTKKISYSPNKIDLELNLSEVSSMVAELSPLVIYFKYILNNKYQSKNTNDIFFFNHMYGHKRKKEYYDILFIEEPEAHLHPEVQVKLIELFVRLSKLKLKIFITSHSNYMFNKLNNILLSNEISEDNIKVYHLINSEKGTINGNDMNVTKDGIDDENFQSVTEKLYYERMEILEKND